MQPSDPQPVPTAYVASLQTAPAMGEVAANVARSIELAEEAVARGARLVVLPELANTGYMFESREEAYALAEPVPEGPSSRAWIELAERRGIYLVAGIAERCGDRLYNSALVAGPQGYIGTYRKLHLWGDENLYFEAGDLGLPVFHTELGRLGVAICYDGWFPEVYRLLALRGADLVAVPTNWVPMPGQTPDGPAMAHALAIAGAHSNGLTVVCADRVGVERGQPFVGRSLIVGSQGWTAAGPASADREEILLAAVDLKAARRGRQLNAFNHVLRDRRCDVYDERLGAADAPAPR
jgi:predicted amidohydrolase